MATTVAGSTHTYDLHSYLEQCEREYPDEVIHVEHPLNADWELTALVMKLEQAKRFPVVICHNVITDGQRAEMPLEGQPLGNLSSNLPRELRWWRSASA